MSQRSFPHTYTDPLLPRLPEIHTERSQKRRQYCSFESANDNGVEVATVCHLSCGKKADCSHTESFENLKIWSVSCCRHIQDDGNEHFSPARTHLLFGTGGDLSGSP